MRKNKLKSLFFSLLTLLVASGVMAQEKQKKALKFKPLKFNLTEDGSQWLRFILWNQVNLNTNNLEGNDIF